MALRRCYGRLKVGTHEQGLVPATSHGDKSDRLNWPFLLENLVAGTNFGPCD